MKLTKEDVISPVWLKLKPELEQMIAKMREQNDLPSLSEQQTAMLRGRIYQVKQILALGEISPQESSADAE